MHEEHSGDQRFSVVQLGARMHYAVPLLFHQAGRLDTFLTDFWYPNFRKKLPFYRLVQNILPESNARRALEARYHPGLQSARVKSFDFKGIQYSRALKSARSRSEQTRIFLDTGLWFARKSASILSENTEGIYAFNSVAEPLFENPKFRNSRKVLEQTLAPRHTEQKILAEEYKRRNLDFPKDFNSPEYEQREIREWELADIILCGSEFVKKSMIKLGAQSEKISVVPYGVDIHINEQPEILSEKDSLHILFAGNGGIRKGLPYLLEAATAFGKEITIHVAGNPEMPEEMLPSADHIIYHGQVPRSKMQDLYQKCSVFVLPSLCEGSATVIYEAMASGLAIICTPNCGSVVTDQKEGVIIPTANTTAIKNAITQFLDDSDFLINCRQQALQTAALHTTAEYKKRVLAAF